MTVLLNLGLPSLFNSCYHHSAQKSAQGKELTKNVSFSLENPSISHSRVFVKDGILFWIANSIRLLLSISTSGNYGLLSLVLGDHNSFPN